MFFLLILVKINITENGISVFIPKGCKFREDFEAYNVYSIILKMEAA